MGGSFDLRKIGRQQVDNPVDNLVDNRGDNREIHREKTLVTTKGWAGGRGRGD